MPYEPQHVDVRNLVLSPHKQGAYGTALLDAKLTQHISFDAGAEGTIGKEWYTDADKAGKGHVFPTQRKVVKQDTGFKFPFELNDFIAGWLGAWGMGKVVVVGPSPYTHTFTFDTTSNIVAVTTVYVEDGGGIKTKYPDLAIAEFELSGAETGPVTGSATLMGSGRFTEVAIAALPPLTNEQLLLGSDTDILLGAPGAPASIKERVRQWSVKVSQGLEIHRAPGHGLYATFTKRGIPRVSVSLVIAMPAADDIRSLYLADTLQELQINTNSGAAAQCNLKFPGLYLSACALGMNGTERVYQVESDENAVIKNGVNDYFQMVVTNSTPAFLVV
ncbi:MAG TPA: phage tail tube protein [Clostridia bacterium]|nr:phage tail tube protein [Clostridia bacterium]